MASEEHEALVQAGLALEKKIKRAEVAERRGRQRTSDAVWALADWLAENTIVASRQQCGRAAQGTPISGLTCAAYARRSGYSDGTLSRYRKAAALLPREVRPPGVTADLYLNVLRECKGDAAAAIAALPNRMEQAATASSVARTRAALTRAERAVPAAKSFADVAQYLRASAQFAEQAGKVLADLDLSGADRETLRARILRIDEAVYEIEPFAAEPDLRVAA